MNGMGKRRELSVGVCIKRWREHRSWSQSQLAELCDLSRVSITRIEYGTQSPSMETLGDIARIMGVSRAELLAGPPTSTRRRAG